MARVGNITPEDGVDYRRLKPHPKNPNEGDIGAVHESIETNGFVVRILAQKSTGFIIDGEHRWRAGQQAGITEFPVDWLDCTDAEAERLLAAINRTTRLGTDNQVKLAELLAELAQTDLGLKGTGFDGDDLDNLLSDLAGMPPAGSGGDEFDATPADGPTRTNSGELWRIGEHRLLIGDSISESDVQRVLGGDIPSLVFADPPYGVDIVGDRPGRIGSAVGRDGKPTSLAGVPGKVYAPVIGDKSIETAVKSFSMSLCFEGAVLVYWGANHYSNALPNSASWIVWDKTGGMESCNFADVELAWVNVGSPARIFRHTWRGMIRQGEDGERVHPNQKPIALAEWVIDKYGEGATILLDPFAGSGMSLIAAHRKGLSWRGVEMSPEYGDVILHRAELEGIHPIELIEHGRTQDTSNP